MMNFWTVRGFGICEGTVEVSRNFSSVFFFLIRCNN